MIKKKFPIQYDYIVRNISEDKESAYEAYIPAFHAIVFGDHHKELEEGILFTIQSEIKERKKSGKPIPSPDWKSSYSGKLILRMKPWLHERLALEAKVKRKSLNKLLEEKLSVM